MNLEIFLSHVAWQKYLRNLNKPLRSERGIRPNLIQLGLASPEFRGKILKLFYQI